MIKQDSIDRVLSAVDIVTVIKADGVKLKRSGRILKGICPFHDDHSPSMAVYEDTQSYYCFVCGAGGNAVNYLMKRKNMTYPEAIKHLGKMFNVEVEETKKEPVDEEKQREKETIIYIYETACDFFRSQLAGTAKEYAQGRFDEETISRWKIGYADNGWQSLYLHLKGKGWTDAQLAASDLFRRNRNGGLYDFFRSRLMFPIFDRTGRVIAFSGRTLDGSEPKYLNSGETIIYNKGQELFGLNFAIPAIRKYDVCVLVEGNADVVKLHQLGVTNVVAACGTALTDEQIAAVGRYTNNFCLLYDSDRAGIEATHRNAVRIIEKGFNVVTLTIPNGDHGEKQDPDSFFRSKSQFGIFYTNNKIDYLIRLAREKAENCTSDANYKARTIKELCRLIYNKPLNERAAIIEDLAREIPTKTLWNKTFKELDDEKRAREHQEMVNGRTKEQNECFMKYGFYVDKNCYHFQEFKGKGTFEGSNFILEPLFHIESTINAKRLYRLRNVYGIDRVVEFPQKDLISISAFKLRCESLGNFRFEAGEYGLAKIKAYLYEKTKTCTEISQLGWQKQGFFAWSNGIYADGQFQPISPDGICTYRKENYYLPALSSFYESDDMLFQFERKFKHTPGTITLYDWLDNFSRVYRENAVVGFSFLLASLFRDIIVNHFRFFPILNIFGPKGTGKSEMAVSLSKMFGDLPVGINMTNSTIAAMADHVSHTRNAVVHIDEYKNSVEYDKIEFLKGLWDGVGRNRMNMDKDKKKEMTAVDSGIILTGQEMTTADIALFSRVIFTSFTKTKFSDDEKALYNRLKDTEKQGLTQITNEILSHRELFRDTYIENYNAACSDMEAKVNKSVIEDRIWRNWMVILGALRTLKDVLSMPFNYEKAVTVMSDMIVRQNNETKANNEISNFWEIYTFLVKNGDLERDYDFRIDHVSKLKTDKVDLVAQKTVIFIEKSRALQLYSKHCKSTGLKALPTATLKYYLENSSEYLGEKVLKLKRRISNLQERTSAFENNGMQCLQETISTRLYAFDYDELALDIETSFEPAID